MMLQVNAMTPIPIPLHLQEPTDHQVKNMLKAYILEGQHLLTTWCTHVFFLPKPGRPNEAHMVIDFTQLKKIDSPPSYPFDIPSTILKKLL